MMTAQRNIKKYIPLLRGVLVLLLALGILMPIVGCSTAQSREISNTEQEMIDYYSVDSVKAFHRDLQNAITDTVTALQTDDTALMTSALKKLDSLCANFAKVKEVPDSLKSYHKKMLEVTEYLEVYSEDIKGNDIDSAAEAINKANTALTQAKKLIPESTTTGP